MSARPTAGTGAKPRSKSRSARGGAAAGKGGETSARARATAQGSFAAVVVAEKPSVARDLARVLGATGRSEGYFHGAGYAVTWAVGHLVELPQPHDIDPAWKRWSLESLPLLPQAWPLQVIERTRSQFRTVAKLLAARGLERVVCATDAGREGELIFRWIYEQARCTRPVQRLWISSLTPDAIRDGLARLRPGADYDALAAAARGRALADWLVGMNLTRAYTLARGERGQVYSVGRVQTPTLAMLVERELAIQRFVPEPYREVRVRFRPEAREDAASYEGVYFDPELERVLRSQKAEDALERARRLPAEGAQAERITARARTGRARVESIDAKQSRMPPPQLYDLTELQRHANRLFGWSAQHTLDLAQALYERAKVLTYPRTDSRHLSASVAATLGAIVATIASRYDGRIAPGSGARPLGPRFVDDARVSDHHAILPTTTPAPAELSQEETQLYDLVCRRLLSAWHPDHVYSTTTVTSAIDHDEGIDRYRSSGTRVDAAGWRVLEPTPQRKQSEESGEDQALPPDLASGDRLAVLDVQNLRKETRPPRRLTEAALLSAMETAGRTLEDRELADAMREGGLGTPATRASIIETLIARGYVTREKKSLCATEKGIALIGAVHPEVKTPLLTARWETELARMERGEVALETFVRAIEGYVSEAIAQAKAQSAPAEGRSTPRVPVASVPHWVKGQEGTWLVRTQPGSAGRTVQVQRRDGSTTAVELGEEVGRQGAMCLYTVRPRAAARAAAR